MHRIVNPEILDSLAPNDPAAIRSRKDLRLVNWLMRGESWIVDTLSEFDHLTKVVEIGAGEGILAAKIKQKFPAVEVIAIDLQQPPHPPEADVIWRIEDVLDSTIYDGNTIVVANLFIHHLDQDQLYHLGEKIAQCRGILVAEPHRYWFSKLVGYTVFPLINHVTKHDMMVSIEAGFRFGELPGLLDVDWHWDERPGLGSVRSVGKRVSV